MRDVPAHYIKENKAARVPKRIIVLAVGARKEGTNDSYSYEWRCAQAMFGHWTGRKVFHHVVNSFTEVRTLWEAVAAFTRPKRRTILYAHNVPYVMRITRGLSELPAVGFKLEAIRVSTQGTWSRWSRDGATLVVCDSASLWPCTIKTLAVAKGTDRLDTPSTDNPEEWAAFVLRDVQILGHTIRQYFEWLHTGVAGNWQLTGAGQSWAHWRHRHYTETLLVHSDQEAIDAERRAMWTGRCEAWQWGKDYRAPVYEWDWANAYPRIVRDLSVPVRLVGHSRKVTRSDLVALMRRFKVLADIEVTTDTPLVPARHDKRILWPVGTFQTTLWDPELQLLLDHGATIRVQQVWLYRSADALKDWATWMLDTLSGASAPEYPWLPILLKHWSRALIGRFATQYQNWELFGYDPVSDVKMGYVVNPDSDELGEFLQVGHEIHVMTGLSESDDSCPQVTSYVMSAARARLWNAIEHVGVDNVLYMDTDSLILNSQGHARMRLAIKRGLFDGLRVKGRHKGYEIFGPRAAVIGTAIKLAGVPRAAERQGGETWIGEVWAGFEKAIKDGEHDRVTVARRKYTVRYNEHRRTRLTNGRTAPYDLGRGQWAIPDGTRRYTPGPDPIRQAKQALRAHGIIPMGNGERLTRSTDLGHASNG